MPSSGLDHTTLEWLSVSSLDQRKHYHFGWLLLTWFSVIVCSRKQHILQKHYLEKFDAFFSTDVDHQVYVFHCVFSISNFQIYGRSWDAVQTRRGYYKTGIPIPGIVL